jgi:hypothetical protein
VQLRPQILKCISGVILIVFTFSLTPKKVWHDLLTSHQDLALTTLQLDNQSDQVHKTVINCNCDQLVVESSFISKLSDIEIKAPIVGNKFNQKPYYFYFESYNYYNNLRGPPAVYFLQRPS